MRCFVHQNFTSGGKTGGFRICPTDCIVYGLLGYLITATDVYIQLFDQDNEPVADDKPVHSWKARGEDNFYCQIPPNGLPFVYGPWLRFSSTPEKYTPVVAEAVVSGTINRP